LVEVVLFGGEVEGHGEYFIALPSAVTPKRSQLRLLCHPTDFDVV